MREYETVFVIRPDGSESQASQLLERLGSIIERHGGTVFQQKNWGKKELAYRVGKYNQGVYYYYDYTGDSGLVADLERTLKLHELPMKYLTVKLADEVDVEARKKELAEKKEEEASAETVSKAPAETAGEASAEAADKEVADG